MVYDETTSQVSPSPPDFYAAAMWWVDRGFKVVPVQPGAKTPFVGYDKASRDEARIARWAAQWPHANIGIATGRQANVTVLDVDRKEHAPGMETIRAYLRRGFELPDGIGMSRTPSNGRHLWFRHCPDLARNYVNILPGIDIRTDGGLIFVPPSRLADGTGYEWMHEPANFRDLPRVPSWLVDEIMRAVREREKADARNAIAVVPVSPVQLADDDRRRYELFARKGVAIQIERLTALTEGRYEAANSAAVALGKWTGNGILSKGEVTGALLDACDKNGIIKKRGKKAVLDNITRGLAFGAKNKLQPLAPLRCKYPRR